MQDRRINVKDDRQLVMGEVRFHIRDELWDPKAMRVHMDVITRFAACLPTAIAAPTTAWSSRPRRW